MIKFKGIAFTVLACFLMISAAEGKQGEEFSPSQISPVYEQMLGNQVDLLRKEMIRRKELKPADPFLVVGWTTDQDALASQITSALKQNHSKRESWEAVFLNDWGRSHDNRPFQGVILLATEHFEILQQAAAYIGRPQSKGFLMVFTRGSATHMGFVQSLFEGAGLRVRSVMTLAELEFSKDGMNRQAINLDFPEYRNQIFERLVREGMNPVNAHPTADKAIQDFRSAKDQKILIVGKN